MNLKPPGNLDDFERLVVLARREPVPPSNVSQAVLTRLRRRREQSGQLAEHVIRLFALGAAAAALLTLAAGWSWLESSGQNQLLALFSDFDFYLL